MVFQSYFLSEVVVDSVEPIEKCPSTEGDFGSESKFAFQSVKLMPMADIVCFFLGFIEHVWHNIHFIFEPGELLVYIDVVIADDVGKFRPFFASQSDDIFSPITMSSFSSAE